MTRSVMEVHLINTAEDKKGRLKMRRLRDRTRCPMLSKEERQIFSGKDRQFMSYKLKGIISKVEIF